MSGNRGFTLIEMLVTLGAGAVVAAGFTAIWVHMSDTQQRANSLTQIEILRKDMLEALGSDKAWSNTLLSPANFKSGFNCIVAGKPCTVDGKAGAAALAGREFAIVDVAGKIVYDGTKPKVGVTAGGMPCNGFDLINGNDDCPFHFDLTWSAVCAPGKCVDPQVKINARFRYRPRARQAGINELKYSIVDYYKIEPVSIPPPPPPPAPAPTPSGMPAGTYNWLAQAWGACSVPTGSGAWTAGAWGACLNYDCDKAYQVRTVTCGAASPGTQTRVVQCVDSSNAVVADSNCNSASKPPTSQACGGCDPKAAPPKVQTCPVQGRACVRRWHTTYGAIRWSPQENCQPAGYLSGDVGKGINTDCTSLINLDSQSNVYWASGITPGSVGGNGGCLAGTFPVLWNQYYCFVCPSGSWSPSTMDIFVAGYGWRPAGPSIGNLAGTPYELPPIPMPGTPNVSCNGGGESYLPIPPPSP